MALDTLRTVLPRWAAWLRESGPLFADSSYPLEGNPPVLLGTIIQRFNVRKGKAAKPYRDNIGEIKQKVINDLLPVLRRSGMAKTDEEYGQELVQNGLCLAEISDFQGVLPKALAAGVPVYALADEEIDETGPVLEGIQQNRARFEELFEQLAAEVLRLTDLA